MRPLGATGGPRVPSVGACDAGGCRAGTGCWRADRSGFNAYSRPPSGPLLRVGPGIAAEGGVTRPASPDAAPIGAGPRTAGSGWRGATGALGDGAWSGGVAVATLVSLPFPGKL